MRRFSIVLAVVLFLIPPRSFADSIIFDSGAPDGQMAVASRPDVVGNPEIEAADDFAFPMQAGITGATFTGLITDNATVTAVDIEIYRVFPKDSADPPSGNVPTRTNSPSDVAFDSRDSSSNTVSFTTSVLSNAFTAANSVLNGIHPIPTQTTGGEGSVSGREVQFDMSTTTPFVLPADHYFFVPQVTLSTGNFYWLSAPRPDTTTVFSPDLQAWVRNENLSPDWLRVGTDIVGGPTPPTFNMAFTLTGNVPEPTPITLLLFPIFGWLTLVRPRLKG